NVLEKTDIRDPVERRIETFVERSKPDYQPARPDRYQKYQRQWPEEPEKCFASVARRDAPRERGRRRPRRSVKHSSKADSSGNASRKDDRFEGVQQNTCDQEYADNYPNNSHRLLGRSEVRLSDRKE